MRPWLGRGKKLQCGISICCLSAFVLFGYEQGVFGPILQNEDWLRLFNHPGDTETGIIVSCYNLGCFVGCVVAFFIGEKLGRRRMIWVAMVFVLMGTALQTSAFHIAHLVIGRVITGMGTGMKTSTVPMYQSELCSPSNRGRLIATELLFVSGGIVFAYWFNFGMSNVGGPIAWRLPIALQALFAIGVIILVFALPESPRWLLNHGREQEAKDVLCAVFDKGADDPFVLTECAAIIRAIELESAVTKNKTVLSIFRKDQVRTRWRVFLAWASQFMQQLCGINVVVYYIPSVLESNVGMSVHLSQIIGGCVQVMFFLGSIVPALRLDRMGRRKTFMYGCAGLCLSMMFIGATLSQSDGGATQRGSNFASASVAFFFIYMLIFGMSLNSVPWVYVPEILPLEARTQGTAIGVSSNWLWNFAVVMVTPILINRLGWVTYLLFMVTNALFVPFIYLCYPETSNISLEDMDLLFSTGENPVKVARTFAAHGKRGEEGHRASTEANEKVWSTAEVEHHNP